MSNGPEQCCAIEVCCSAAAARLKVSDALVFKGMLLRDTQTLHDWMEEKGLMFAPISLRPFIQDIVTKTKAHGSTASGG